VLTYTFRPASMCSRRTVQWSVRSTAATFFPTVCTENLIQVDDVIESPKLAK